ncbi:PAS domain S-box protein [Azospirillum sp. SYSU D00513]|uniref:PAS domain S-box protein n=1 Tax=Azospirillum sp. SYSU D00513 TaxID=2812561 RepID=UPI001A95AB68|nr:PAS domain S-box protein [Azospirillum sp. SYSU D00513]
MSGGLAGGTSVRTRLVLLVLACILPLTLFTTGLGYRFLEAQNRRLAEQVDAQVHALAGAVERYISETQLSLEILATSPALQAGDLARFHAQIMEAVKKRGIGIVLLDPDGQQLASTNRPYGSPLPRRTELETLRRVVETGRPQVSDLVQAAVQRRPILSVEVPVFVGGGVRYVLAMGLLPETLGEVIRAQRLPDAWTGVVLDRKMLIAGRSHDEERLIGQPGIPGVIKALETSDEGHWTEMPSRDGQQSVYVTFHRSAVTGWTTAIAVPRESLIGPFRQQLWLLAGTAVLLLGIGLLLAMLVARGITRPLARLAWAGTAGGPADPAPARRASGITEIDRVAGLLSAQERERDKALALVRAGEERFRHLADNAPVMVWVTEPDGRCSYLSRSWYEFTGQMPETGLGFGWLDATHPDDKPGSEKAFRDANATQRPFRVEYRLRRADGEYRWAIDAAAPHFADDGTFLGYIGSVIDITEMKEAGEALRLGEERFRQLANLAPAFVWFGNPDGTITWLNDRWYEYTGQTPEQALPNGWADTLHPDDAARTATTWEHSRTHQVLYEVEVRYRRYDGEHRWYLARAEPVRDADGTVTGWFGASTDIHDRKLAEEEVRTLNATLEARVTEEVQERERAQAALLQAQKTEALGQLTGGVAHDFNNLLQAMSGCLQMIGRRVQDPRVGPLLDAGRQAVERGAKLVQQLMAFARREALRPEPVNVRDRVLGMTDLLSQALRASVRLEVDFAPGLWPVEVDPTQFELALINLAVNARDAMPGGGTLTVRASNATLAGDGPGGLSGEFLRLSVSDTGAGMPAEVRARAFDPFFTTKEVGKGTGLGLSQVYGFARQSGGTALIDSEEGRGTTVHILLPRTAAAPAAGDPRPAQPGAGTRVGGRVLVVEDDPIVAMTVGTALEDAGFTVLRAATADEALPLLETGAVDLLFSDVVMPGSMSGVDLAREAQSRFPGLPVILATGYSEEIARATGIQVLAKPYRIDHLVRLLDGVLSEAAGVDEAASA